jgi:Mu transposase-like protein
VFDRPKTVALKWGKDGQVTEWNPIFAGVALDLSVGIEVCWPSRPEQKGSIENLVGWVKGSFFKQRRFLDDADLLAQLAEWRTEVNTQRPSRATGLIPAVRLEDERPRLRAVKVAPDQLALRVPVVVGPTAAVVHDTHPYSMPPDAIGIPGTLFLYRDRVRIVAGRFEATHQRLFEPHATSTLPEHRAQHVAAVSGKRAKRYLQREHLLALGASALDYLTELTHRRPRIWIRDVDRLHDLLATYGDDAVRAAFARGLAEQAIGAEYIAHYLAAAVTTPPPMEGDGTGHPPERSSFLGHPDEPISRDDPLPFDLPSAIAANAPRGGRVQAAAGARAAGRRAWTRPSTGLPFDADGGR